MNKILSFNVKVQGMLQETLKKKDSVLNPNPLLLENSLFLL
jgi:hypothetical protein